MEKAPPFQCKPDSGLSYVNQNAFRCPDSPLSPLVESVRYWEPEFDFSVIDLVTDRNNLRKLLAWAEGSKDEFRIDIQRASAHGVLFMRWQPLTRVGAQNSYGIEFERAMTKLPSGTSSAGHHRIVTYVSA